MVGLGDAVSDERVPDVVGGELPPLLGHLPGDVQRGPEPGRVGTPSEPLEGLVPQDDPPLEAGPGPVICTALVRPRGAAGSRPRQTFHDSPPILRTITA